MKNNRINLSPWIHELDYSRKVVKVTSSFTTDVAIVGGGIAGVTTAFFTLKYTDKKVTLIEGWRIGHGATGHNAGQVVDYFEKPFSEIVEEYGLEMALDGQKSVSSAWDLLEEIIKDTKIGVPFSKFIGYAGCSDLQQLLNHFENKRLKVMGGLDVHKARVADNFKHLRQIPKEYKHLYTVVPQSEILELLETDNPEYIAALQSQKGCLNSALFVEEVSKYLIKEYKSRFQLFEESPVSLIELNDNEALLKIANHSVKCEKVILCTNGFENLDIKNNVGENINRKYHDMVYGIVGYMAGYVEEWQKDPIAISYLPQINPNEDETRPYFYLTRRNHKHAGNGKSLICIGGPESIKNQDNFQYSKEVDYKIKAENDIGKFLKGSFKRTPADLKDFHYKWHGLMGYTESGIRCVGFEPLNNALLYNLGCNGVGILPSIFGARKISKHIAGKKLNDTIFDPQIQRKVLHKNKITKHMNNFQKLSKRSKNR